ncbi:MAG: hypothetical protein ACI8RD_005908, partial [Bacillariaceae sp.]
TSVRIKTLFREVDFKSLSFSRMIHDDFLSRKRTRAD